MVQRQAICSRNQGIPDLEGEIFEAASETQTEEEVVEEEEEAVETEEHDEL